ncbi:MAG: hypothetical protein U5N55_01550 [Cypionkella sp.]|nr:hypothetical protein [Cypionkella sp.]
MTLIDFFASIERSQPINDAEMNNRIHKIENEDDRAVAQDYADEFMASLVHQGDD